MASNPQDPLLGVVERQSEPKRRRRTGRSAFNSAELHKRFEQHVAKAQNLFLQGDKDGAEREATLALRIHPTDHLFALLAVIAESKGHRDRASDFRLLQAFLANDTVLWEELLHEFLQEQLYYKSAVCLQRLSALETKDKTRYRTLQLQLADLYIGLGEVKRAANILIPLWNGSRCRDFEVFALLSSLFFQLGRWNSLHRLIESSLKSAFRPTPAIEAERKQLDPSAADTGVGGTATYGGEGEVGTVASTTKRRTSKRVRFFGIDDDNDADINNNNNNDTTEVGEKEQHKEGTSYASASVSASAVPVEGMAKEEEEEDDFDFSNMTGSSGAPPTKTVVDTTPSAVVHSLYGDTIELQTPTAKKNFLTLVNVHAELLNEEGHFLDTVRLMEFTAGCMQVQLLELPPDLLVRLGVAYAYLGGLEQQCREVFHHIVDTCPMAEYGDVLYDAANALQQVGLHTEAHLIFQTLRRYHEFRLSSSGSTAEGDADVDAEEMSEVKTVFAAALFAEGQCEASLGNTEVAYNDFLRVLQVEPTHLQARLALGRMYVYELKDTDQAVVVLTPREDEPPLERIQLGAELVRVFARAEKYVEAIALGVSIFELILSGEEDGDTESVAPGSSRRSSAPLSMPTLSRASSAIIPPSAISEIVNGPRLTSMAASSMGRLSHTLATSIRAASATFRSNLARRGSAPLTNSIYGASAAASTAAGWARADEEERLKDSSTIFRFHRQNKPTKRPRHAGDKEENSTKKNNTNNIEKSEDVEEDGQLAKRRRRVEEVTHLGVESFWKESDEEKGKDKEASGVKTEKEDEACGDKGHKVKEEGLDERDLTELEEALRDVGEDDDNGTAAHYELPSLEEVSKQFNDPAMRELFMQASTNDAPVAPHNPWDPSGVAPVAAAAPAALPLDAGGLNVGEGGGSSGLNFPPAPSSMRVTVRDALGVLGRAGFVELAVTVIDCYTAIGKFTEAKEFAFVILTRCPRTSIFRHVGALERPLRWAVLRAALASQESEDAYRVGIRLLQEQCSEEEKNRVVELLFSVLNRVEDGSAILLRLVADRNQADPPMLILLGNRYFLRRSYIRALNLYLAALQKRPNDVLVCFLVGLSYMLISHQKKIRARDACVVAGWHYLARYQETVCAIDAQRLGEAVYNCARAFQYLGLHHLAIPLYEQVAYEYSVPEQCTLALQRAARWNLYFTYRWRTGNAALAIAALHPKR
ncbi:hypothetical protein DQ04_01661080 [Trypanosoma grayi]|uniref:hypothetical protein n=1 Tax=Trypanosoma grayi TaxID=71804 RepID=UPI0004F3F9FC|nr:hypothetical protein DQ04_01661080 [Trypanosoma grayi]KEG12504.1 hypothetical protein DQ04_01661080 [Trypanosoma grayi]